jgi:hypothetical protein
MDPKETPKADAGVQDSQQKSATPGAKPGAPAGSAENDQKGVVDLRALHEARDTIRELKMELDAVKQMQQQTQMGFQPGQYGYAPQPQPQYQQGPDPMQQQQAALEELWATDPRRAMKTELMMAMNWRDKVDSNVDFQLDSLAQKHPDVNSYRGEITKYVRTLPLEQRNVPGVVQAAYYYVKGQKVDDLINLSKEEIIQKIRRGELAQGISGSGAGAGDESPAVKPTEDQVKAASALGMSIEDYMAHRR